MIESKMFALKFSKKARTILHSIKMKVKRSRLYNYRFRKKVKDKLEQNRIQKCAYLIGTTAHNNLGDHAISKAEVDFIKKYFPDYLLFEIEDREVYRYLIPMKKIVKMDDIIFLHGGGNVGTEYIDHEIIRRTVISSFPSLKIIVFPQTLDYRDNQCDIIELKKSAKIYNHHDKLLFMFREVYSYKAAKSLFVSTKCILMPDIVLSLSIPESINKMDLVCICIRNDVESVTPLEIKEKIIKECKKKCGNLKIIDTIYRENFGKDRRSDVLFSFWRELSLAKLVVTDRLHCMVFCHLLNIRCVALPNYNHKVKGTYNWIKENLNIRYFDEYVSAIEYIKGLDIDSQVQSNPVDLGKYYDSMAEQIRYY